MARAPAREEAKAFFDAFVEAFLSFDGREIARRYRAPYMALRANGLSEVFSSDAAIAEYFQRIVDGYHGRECRACRYGDLEVTPIGRAAVLASVTWDLLRGDGSVLSSWRESYGLSLSDGRVQVFVSIDH